MSINNHDAIFKFKQFLGKERYQLPWLTSQWAIANDYDCAAAVSYILGVKPEIISCHIFHDYLVKNHTWTTDIRKVAADPESAWVAIFDWEHKGAGPGHNTNTDHIGIIESVDLAKNTITYISADSIDATHKTIPGHVTRNTISVAWVTGFGIPTLKPVSTIPVVNPAQSAAHNAPTFGLGGQPVGNTSTTGAGADVGLSKPTFGIGGQPVGNTSTTGASPDRTTVTHNGKTFGVGGQPLN